MEDAARHERFEEAAQLRDAMRTVQTLRDRQQKVATAGLGDRDVFGIKVGPSGSAIQVFQIRGGRVVERVELSTDPDALAGGDRDVLQAALGQFYEVRPPAPEINLPVEIEDVDAMEEWLSSRAGRRVRVLVPQRGDKRALVELATRNAELSYRTRFNEITAAHFDALETLRGELVTAGDSASHRVLRHLDDPGQRDRGVDGRLRRRPDEAERVSEVSAFRGSARIRADPELHRPIRAHDDFAAMREVVQRRYRAVLEAGGPFPDLIVIDGGKGQLSAAYEALESIGLANLVAVGIAKKEELLFTRDRQDPLALAESDPALLLIQRIRDEAHRFAVTFHRKARSMRDLRSELDSIPGIGANRRRALLTAVRQPGRRAPRDARGAGVSGRRQGRGRGHRLLRAQRVKPPVVCARPGLDREREDHRQHEALTLTLQYQR